MKLDSKKLGQLYHKDLKICIIFSEYNSSIGNELLKNCYDTLTNHRVSSKNIDILRVPGALETPLAAQAMASKKKYDAIIALGIVLKGETYHFELVCDQTYSGLMRVSLENKIPVIFGIIAAKTKAEAMKRAQKKGLNKGEEYAETAIQMATLMKNPNVQKFPSQDRI